jgi:hypothetical protein
VVDADGRHLLVTTGGRRAFELLLDRENLCWRVVRAPDDVRGGVRRGMFPFRFRLEEGD